MKKAWKALTRAQEQSSTNTDLSLSKQSETILIPAQTLQQIRRQMQQTRGKSLIVSINEILAAGTAFGFIVGTIGFVSLESLF